MNSRIFNPDIESNKTKTVYPRVPVTKFSAKLESDDTLNLKKNAINFADEVNARIFADFEKEGDLMCHVATFKVIDKTVYVSYYANTNNEKEDPNFQVARLAYCPIDDPKNKTVIDVQTAGDELYGHKVDSVYDTIIMQRDDEPQNLYILWTAKVDGKYYRLYRIFNIETKTLGDIGVNRFKVGNTVNDFSFSGMQNALMENNIGFKDFFSDIGIMQKQSFRIENGVKYYYSGAYSGNFTCIIKSKDLITWEYVAQPNEGANNTGFENQTKWENAIYVLNDKVYYFVRQWEAVKDDDGNITYPGSPYGVLSCYDLNTCEWATPLLVGDNQSRSDFILYKDNLYLFHAPTDRHHIGILKIDTEDLSKTKILLQANMNGSLFYPFVDYFSDGELAMAYTVDRKHIRLSKFTLSKYL